MQAIAATGRPINHAEVLAALLDPEAARQTAALNAERAILEIAYAPDPMAVLPEVCTRVVDHHLGVLVSMSGRSDADFLTYWRATIVPPFVARMGALIPWLNPTARTRQ